VAMDNYAIAIILALLNLFTLRALLPLKHRLEKASDSAAESQIKS